MSDAAKRRLSMPTIVLTVAAVLAIASAGIAISRSGGSDDEDVAGPHGSAKPEEPVGDVGSMIASLEARLKTQPNDPQGWRMLGWSHFETGDLMRSAAAYRRAAEIEPDNAENWSSLGEALQTASTGVDQEAAAAFERAITLDPADPRARYFIGVQKDLSGRHEAAIADWIALLKDTPAGAPWEADLRRTIQQVAAKERIELAGKLPPASATPSASAATAAIPGPTPQEMAAASSLPPSQQSEMVQGMVDRLAARLKREPKDADGWMRLMRAHMVLGKGKEAAAALRSGLAAFPADKAAQAQLNRAAEELGVPRG